MDNEFQSKIDEIGTAFERWAKEVADRIVDAAKQGAAAASEARTKMHDSWQERGDDGAADSRDARPNGSNAPHAAKGTDGATNGTDSDADPWHEWARMRKDTWNRWASGKFDKAADGDTMREFYREARQRWNDSPFGQMCDELFQQVEKVMRTSRTRADEDAAESAVREVIGEFVDVEVESQATSATSAASGFAASSSPEHAPSEYAQGLVDRIKEMDRDIKKPKKLAKALVAMLEKDLAKMKKKKKK